MHLAFLYLIIPGPRNILWIPASAADATVINPSRINIVLANDWSKFFINNRAILINDPRSLPTNRPDCIILKSSVSNNFMLLDEFFTKALQRLATCSLVISNLWGNYFDCHESYLMIILMSPLLRFLQLILIYLALKLITLHLPSWIGSFYNNAKINSRKKNTILLQLLFKNTENFLGFLQQ